MAAPGTPRTPRSSCSTSATGAVPVLLRRLAASESASERRQLLDTLQRGLARCSPTSPPGCRPEQPWTMQRNAHASVAPARRTGRRRTLLPRSGRAAHSGAASSCCATCSRPLRRRGSDAFARVGNGAAGTGRRGAHIALQSRDQEAIAIVLERLRGLPRRQLGTPVSPRAPPGPVALRAPKVVRRARRSAPPAAVQPGPAAAGARAARRRRNRDRVPKPVPRARP